MDWAPGWAKRLRSPQADGRDRRNADPLAHHEDLLGPWRQRLHRLPWLQGLYDQGVSSPTTSCTRPTSRSTCSKNRMEVHQNCSEPWRITLVDTGAETHDRRPPQARSAPYLERRRGLLLHLWRRRRRRSTSRELIAFHRGHGKKATITAVAPPGRFGALEFDGDQVHELPRKAATATAA